MQCNQVWRASLDSGQRKALVCVSSPNYVKHRMFERRDKSLYSGGHWRNRDYSKTLYITIKIVTYSKNATHNKLYIFNQ